MLLFSANEAIGVSILASAKDGMASRANTATRATFMAVVNERRIFCRLLWILLCLDYAFGRCLLCDKR